MAGRPGRNAPCPCGSGRKYKLCCLPADEALERAGGLAAPASGRPQRDRLAIPDDPDAADAWDGVWDRFTGADYEEQIATFEDALATRTVDGELAFEMLSEIQAEAAARGELGRFRALLERFARALPTLYARDAAYYAGWLLDEALASGDTVRLPALLAPLAERPDEQIDEVLQLARRLTYYGQIAPLLEVLRRGWPAIEKAHDREPGVAEEYGSLVADLLVLQYVSTAPNPRADDPALFAEVRCYVETEQEQLEQNVAALLGQSGRSWRASDLESPPRGEPRGRRLFLLAEEWAGEAWRRHGVVLGRAALAADALAAYQDEHASKGMRAARMLVPAPRPLERFLAQQLDVLIYDLYRAGALVELLPLYLDFLVERELIEASAARRAVAELRPVEARLLQDLELARADPALTAAIRARWPAA